MKLGQLAKDPRAKERVAGGAPSTKQDYLEMFYLTGRLSSGKEAGRDHLHISKKYDLISRNQTYNWVNDAENCVFKTNTKTKKIKYSLDDQASVLKYEQDRGKADTTSSGKSAQRKQGHPRAGSGQ